MIHTAACDPPVQTPQSFPQGCRTLARLQQRVRHERQDAGGRGHHVPVLRLLSGARACANAAIGVQPPALHLWCREAGQAKVAPDSYAEGTAFVSMHTKS